MRLLRSVFLFSFCMVSSAVQASAPQRVVTIGGEITELVYALGKADAVVGVDTSSVYPHAALQKPKVGYARALSAEGILSLRPDTVLVTKDAGPKAVLEQLKQAKVNIIEVPTDYSQEGFAQKAQVIATILGEEEKVSDVVQALKQKMAELKVENSLQPKKILYFMQHGHGSPLVAGQGTAVDTFIRMAGGVNAAQGFEGYKPFNMEAVQAAAPDVILISSNTVEQKTEEMILAMPGIDVTPAGKNKRIITLDTLQIMAYGPRTPEALAQLREVLNAVQ